MKTYSKGARVAQPEFGPGTVTDANERHTVIDFDNHGPRRFMTSMVTLAPTSEPAPGRAPAARRAKRATTAKAGAAATSAPAKTAPAKAATAKSTQTK